MNASASTLAKGFYKHRLQGGEIARGVGAGSKLIAQASLAILRPGAPALATSRRLRFEQIAGQGGSKAQETSMVGDLLGAHTSEIVSAIVGAIAGAVGGSFITYKRTKSTTISGFGQVVDQSGSRVRGDQTGGNKTHR